MLEIKKGIHLYINVKNIASIVKKDQNKNNDVTHALHALNVFFKCIESYAKCIGVTIEKVTGSRLHLFIEGNTYDLNEEMVEKLFRISKYAVHCRDIIMDSSKYRSIPRFIIQMGACYGKFYYYKFVCDKYEEVTSIGYPANVGAKLQSKADDGKLLIPYDIFEIGCKKHNLDFIKGTTSFTKYELGRYYIININPLKIDFPNSIDDKIREEIINVSLGEITFSNFKTSFSFDSLSVKNCKEGNAVILMADIRNSTKMYEKNNTNLDEMNLKTQEFMEIMYSTVIEFNGIHVQFQGDREVAVFSPNNAKNAILAALMIQEKIKNINLDIGIGIEYGMIYASRIGVRDEKDNVILGESVDKCDEIEDSKANCGDTVISKNVSDLLKTQNENDILKIFSKESNPKTNQTYNSYLESKRVSKSNQNYYDKSYNGAWNE